MLKNFNKHKNLYLIILILSIIFLIGGYQAFKKYNNKSKDIVKISKEKPLIKVDEKLLSKEWVWQQSTLSESQLIKPRLNTFKIKFNSDGSLNATTD